jgi:hypothetical protein
MPLLFCFLYRPGVLRLLLRYRCTLVDLLASIAEVVAHAVYKVHYTHVISAVPTTNIVVLGRPRLAQTSRFTALGYRVFFDAR